MVDETRLGAAIRDLKVVMHAKGWTDIEVEVGTVGAAVRGVSPRGPDFHRRHAATAEASVRSLTEYFQSKTYVGA